MRKLKIALMYLTILVTYAGTLWSIWHANRTVVRLIAEGVVFYSRPWEPYAASAFWVLLVTAIFGFVAWVAPQVGREY